MKMKIFLKSSYDPVPLEKNMKFFSKLKILKKLRRPSVNLKKILGRNVMEIF